MTSGCAQEGERTLVEAGGSFTFEEATVSSVHVAMAAGDLSCAELTEFYLRRIEAYDQQGPALNALLAVNPRAQEIATEMDREFARSGTEGRALHCVPVILKDNYDTFDMPTTGAAVALAGSIPPDDAFVVARLRQAGALFLAKSNLTELARGGTTVSSLGGQTRNPYDLTRTPGGSSGGTGAAVAADFGLLGTGSDTGQSIRSPSSANSLVGIRPTRGLVSRDGIIPISFTQDEVGPIVRTVEDAARMLDVMAGYDPEDPIITAFGLGLSTYRPVTPTSWMLPASAARGSASWKTYRGWMRFTGRSTLDAILYPHQKRLVVPIGEDQVERNGVLSNSTGFPAITIQGGFSEPTEAAPIGVPVGIELLGPAWSEPTLIRLGYAFEQGTHIRRPPPSTPQLP